jgi:hydroxyethylthiazole kinase
MDGTMYADLFTLVHRRRPLVHHITNRVTINDCANITLCAGASPVMAEAPEEAAEMTEISGALVLNIGTLTSSQIDSMLIAGSRANGLGIPIILDPVGAGATRMRTAAVLRLLNELDIAILKGNPGEIGIISGLGGTVRGVDSGGVSEDPVKTVRECARITGAVVAMTGEVDIVADDRRVFLVGNGTPMMGELSGTGCMASSVTGAFAAVSADMTTAAVAALAAFGLAGERAMARSFGPYSFRTALFDGMYTLGPDDLAAGAKVRVPDGI